MTTLTNTPRTYEGNMAYTRQDMEELPPGTILQMSKQGHRTLVGEWRTKSGEISPYADQFLPAEIIH